MIPPKTDPRWARLLNGTTEHKFRCVPAGLMLSRVRRELAADGSPVTTQKFLDEVFSFFQRYETIMGDDIKAVFGQEA